MDATLKLMAVETAATVVASTFAAAAIVYCLASLRSVAQIWRPCVFATLALLALELLAEAAPLVAAEAQAWWRIPALHYAFWLVIFPVQATILVMVARGVSSNGSRTGLATLGMRFILPAVGLLGAILLFPSATSGALAALAGLAVGYELVVGAPGRAVGNTLDASTSALYSTLCVLAASGCIVYPLGFLTSHLGGAANDPVLSVAFSVAGSASRTAFALLVLREAARQSVHVFNRQAFFTEGRVQLQARQRFAVSP